MQSEKKETKRQASKWFFTQREMKIMFVAYLIILLRVIIFKLPVWQMKEIINTWTKEVVWEGMGSANFEVFKTIKMYWRYWGRGINSFENLVGNVLAFVPLGYFLPRIFKIFENVICCMCMAFLFVCFIELFQLFSAFGAFDVDDIILNCLGNFIGYICFLVLRKVLRIS